MIQAASDMPRRPGFMTPRMWFVWLLRGDPRGAHPIGGEEGQREFVIWWLLWGHQFYGPTFTAGPEQLAIAMEPVPAGGGTIPRLLCRLHRESEDLRRLFDLETAAGRAEYLAWFKVSGLGELGRAAPESSGREGSRPARANRSRPGDGFSLLEAGGELQARLPAGAEALARVGLSASPATPPAWNPDDDDQPLVRKPPSSPGATPARSASTSSVSRSANWASAKTFACSRSRSRRPTLRMS